MKKYCEDGNVGTLVDIRNCWGIEEYFRKWEGSEEEDGNGNLNWRKSELNFDYLAIFYQHKHKCETY